MVTELLHFFGNFQSLRVVSALMKIIGKDYSFGKEKIKKGQGSLQIEPKFQLLKYEILAVSELLH